MEAPLPVGALFLGGASQTKAKVPLGKLAHQMIIDRRISPQNGLIFITGDKCAELPEWQRGDKLRSNDSCVVMGTRPPCDGETRLSVTNDRQSPGGITDLRRVFRGEVSVPSGELQVFTVLLEQLAGVPANSTKCTVEVWVDDPQEPAEIWVGVRPH
jgi:hypothetical protein